MKTVTFIITTLSFVLIIFAIFIFAIDTDASAAFKEFEVSQKITPGEIDKYQYILDKVSDVLDGSVIEFSNAYIVNVIRINKKELCAKGKCLGFIVLNCDSEICPYVSAPIGRYFMTSLNYGRVDAFKSFASVGFFDKDLIKKRTFYASFLVNKNFIILDYYNAKFYELMKD